MTKHVLITGGMGFIGHTVAKKYLQSNFEVTIVDNLTSHKSHANLTKYRMQQVDHKKCTFIDINCNLTYFIRQQLKNPNVRSIIHLAGYPNQAAVEENKQAALSSMLADTHSVGELAKKLNAKLVYVSSSMAYGNFTKMPMPETEPLNPINLYGLLKAHGESIVKLFFHNHVIVRPSAAYGPGDNTNRVLGKWINAAMNNEDIVVDQDNTLLDFTHVDDLAKGIIAAETNGRAGEIYNLTYGSARTLGEAARIIKDETGSKSKIITNNIERLDVPIRGALDISNARNNIGYQPKIDLLSGIQNYIDWMRRYSHVY